MCSLENSDYYSFTNDKTAVKLADQLLSGITPSLPISPKRKTILKNQKVKGKMVRPPSPAKVTQTA